MKKIIFTIILASCIFAVNAQTQYLEKLYVQAAGSSAEAAYHGLISIKKPAASAQYINLARYYNATWSIGTVYDSNTFAIGQSTTVDAQFTTPAFTIRTDGNVGIGSYNPAYKLDINLASLSGVARFFNGTNYFKIGGLGSGIASLTGWEDRVALGNIYPNGSTLLYAGNQERLRISSAGNFGIGTTTPGAKFDIVGAYNNLSLRITNDTYNDWVLQKRRSDNTQLFGIKETGSNGSMAFVTNNIVRVTVDNVGNLGIGTPSPDYKLDVNGTIRATEILVVSPDSFPDYVFKPNYELTKLEDVDAYIQNNGHLKDIPSASEVKEKGMSLADMQIKLLQKVEELTLYAIEQQKQIESLKSELSQLKK